MIEPSLRLALVALLATTIAGCVRPQRAESEAEPRTYGELAALVSEIKAFEKRIGFQPTKNFLHFSGATEAFPFCGYVSRFYLPYSYEDPAIQWVDSATEEHCRAFGESADVFFGASEALGESDTPVTASMLAAPLDRLLYLVIHEDCHDQFALPYGVEEAVCEVMAFKAMGAYNEEKFGSRPLEYKAVRRYTHEGLNYSLMTTTYYEKLAALYARADRSEISPQTLLRQRERIFRRAERALEWEQGSMSNVLIANAMTYSRHYRLIEGVFEALGRDLARTVAFFKQVDAMKPSRAEVMRKHGLAIDSGVAFIRAYEAAVVETIEKALLEVPVRGNA